MHTICTSYAVLIVSVLPNIVKSYTLPPIQFRILTSSEMEMLLVRKCFNKDLYQLDNNIKLILENEQPSISRQLWKSQIF